MVNVENLPKAYSEVYCLMNELGDDYIKKIPASVYNIIKEKRDKDYNVEFDVNKEFDDDMISQEGLTLIALLNLEYWCEDEEEKSELKSIYSENEKKQDERILKNELFKIKSDNENSDETSQGKSLSEYKKSFFNRIIIKIKNMFNHSK